jgi:ATP-dependent Lon protease
VDDIDTVRATGSRLLPVLPMDDGCLFPGAWLVLEVHAPSALAAVRLAERTGGDLLVLGYRESHGGPRDVRTVGTVAAVRSVRELAPVEHQVELDGVSRARVETLLGADVLVAETLPVAEGDAGDEWGAAVEALARYLHSHATLREFLEKQRRSADPMSWVNLACQHLPIAASARQKLLEANAPERCLKISRGLDALLRKETDQTGRP